MSKAPITRLSGLDINSTKQGFYLPLLSTATIAAIPANELRDGLLVANSTTNALQVRLNGALRNVNTSPTTATGAGLNGSPLILPSGASAAVQIAGNNVNGFMYYNTTANNVKGRVNGVWGTFNFTPDA